MSISKVVLEAGDKSQVVQKYDEVALEYTGWIYDPSQPDGKGTKFDTSIGRGDTVTVIGAGRLLKGWDKGVLGDYCPENPKEPVAPMALNEKARFVLPHTYAYGINGFPGWVPKKATLIYSSASLLWNLPISQHQEPPIMTAGLISDSEMELKRIGPHRAP
ncbi:FK506 binding protein proline rotamase rapamycin-binding protein [Curvularia kusanoi]|uniref:peptidylprolyl isomerase n=1 Tax=Curvularia kusanoi TaxID=90978 RepID=A0A9P4T811_CURKU|nr:FK506 binding protein proline rotamase rapamycin-binding protein [Curvularia kusanoi]